MNRIKNTNTNGVTKHLKNILTATAVFVTAITITACSMVGGFSRGTAAGLMEKDNRYTAPSTMTIDIGGRIANAGGKAWQISADDTAEAAAIRAKEDFMQRQPQIILAEHLGFITLSFEEPEMGDRQFDMPIELQRQRFGTWHFKVREKITEKGKALWTDLNLPVNEEYLPLAVRGTPEITGLKDDNANTKSADFTYVWEANELGKAFDPDNEEFNKLPANLQEALKKTQYNTFGGGGNNIMNFKQKRAARVFFEKFDDGWRLREFYFM